MMKVKTPYSDVIINAFKSIQAWKSLAMVLMGILVFETFALGWLASQRTVLLIPQNLGAKSAITLNLGEPFSPDYLTSVAQGDIYFLLNWTPDNIEKQYSKFLTRLTPELYTVQKESLMAEAEQHREEDLTQSYHVTRSFVRGATVELSGVLVRSVGGREVFRGPASYEINYVDGGSSMLLVAGVTQPQKARK